MVRYKKEVLKPQNNPTEEPVIMSEVLGHRIDGVKKRDNVVVPFSPTKIEDAVRSAAEEEYSDEHQVEQTVQDVTGRVLEHLKDPESRFYLEPDQNNHIILPVERAQDVIEFVLYYTHPEVYHHFSEYRNQRERARETLSIRTKQNGDEDITDSSLLLVNSIDSEETQPWDREWIVHQLLNETDLENDEARAVAKHVENRVVSSGFKTVDTTLIREFVNNVLREKGYDEELRDLSIYRVSRQFIDNLMYSKSAENSNVVSNNPEAVNMGLSEYMLKQWALDNIFSEDVKVAHEKGSVHVHDLGYPHRVYCSSHSLEYLKKYGLTGLQNLNTESAPANSASVLSGHLNTFLASMQAYYAGALGITYINILYAPYLTNKSWKEYKQIAQELIFNGSQNAFSRGGQTLFLDFNIHSGVPNNMRNVPAIGPGGKYMLKIYSHEKSHVLTEHNTLKEIDTIDQIEQLRDVYVDEYDPNGYPLMELYYGDELVLKEQLDKQGNIIYDQDVEERNEANGYKVLTYGDYEHESRSFAKALLDVWQDGDKNGKVFEFPKCDFHITKDTFRNDEEYEVFRKACELASANGSTYFIFDRDEVTLSACCRLRTTIDNDRMLKHPENMRFCGFQNVTINLPQAAYRAYHKRGFVEFEEFMKEVRKAMDVALQAHLQKREKIQELMESQGRPLYQIGKPSADGQSYVDLDQSTYIIGLIGLNDAMKFMYGQDLHEGGEDIFEKALDTVSKMYAKTKVFTKQHGLKFTLEESPAESATRRLAKTDLTFYPDDAKQVVKGGVGSDMEYYTNSSHLPPDCDAGLIERIRKQGQFHNMIESGAITHAFVGEETPSSDSIAKIVKDTLFKTQTAQITISPELCYCNDCGFIDRGIRESCVNCGGENLTIKSRIVGYFSDISNWSKSKIGELQDRHKGDYQVEEAQQTDSQMVTA